MITDKVEFNQMSAFNTTFSTMLKFTIFCVCVLATFATAHPFLDSNRIVNGANAEPGEIPFIVSLRYSGIHSCGGSILDKAHILTAAHCVDGRTPNQLTVQYGVTNINSNVNVIKVAGIYIHEKFDPFHNNANDLAILKLGEGIIFGDNAKAIELPKHGETFPAGKLAILAGWGLDKSGGNVQWDLQRVEIMIYSDADCSKVLEPMVDKKYHVCAGIPKEGGKGQCTGDAGGPLILKTDSKLWGVASWSVKPCGAKDKPGVFARLSTYNIDWIEKTQLL